MFREFLKKIPPSALIIALFGLLMIAALWVFMLAEVRQDHAETAAAEIKKNGNLALAHEEHVIRLLREADQLLLLMKEQHEQSGPKSDLKRLVAAGVVDLRTFTYIGVADERGDVIAAGRDYLPVNVADRDYFKYHQQSDGNTLRVGEPVLGRSSKRWGIPLTRRFNKPDGSFGGVVNVVVDPQFFTGLFQNADLGPSDLLALIRTDGIILARRIGAERTFGENVSASRLMIEQRKNRTGHYLAKGALDNRLKFFSYRTLKDYPLIVIVATLEADVFAPVRQREKRYYLQSAFACILIFGICSLLIVMLWREQRSTDALRISEERLATTLQSIGDAVIATDTQGHITRMNPVAEQLTGWTLADALGKTLTDVFRIVNAQTREVSLDPVQQVLKKGEIVGLANHTTLLARDGREYQIADSAAPIRDAAGRITGVVLVFSNVTEQYSLRQTASESEELFRAAFESAGVGMVLRTLEPHNTRWLRVNQKFLDILGYTREEILQLSFAELSPAEDRPETLGYTARVQKGEAAGYMREKRYLHKDGHIVWANISVAVVKNTQGHATQAVVVIVDITARKQAEVMQARLAGIVEDSNDAIYSRTMDGTILTWNAGAQRMLGYSADEVIGKSTDIIRPEGRASTRKRNNDRVQRGEREVFEADRLTKDGRVLRVMVSYSPLRDHAGAIVGVALILQDVTERRQAQETQARLSAIMDNSNDAIYSRTLEGTILSWNAGAEKMIGYTAAEAIGQSIILARVPGNASRIQENNERALRGDMAAREVDVLTKDGRVIRILATHTLIRDRAEQVIGVSVIQKDITLLKRVEAALRESDELFRAAFEGAGVGMAIVAIQPQGSRWSRVNQKLVDILGYPRDELLRLTTMDVTPLEDHAASLDYNSRLQRGETTSYAREKRYLRKDGTVLWANLSFASVQSVAGRPTQAVVLIEDISERKQAEAARAALEMQLRESQKMEAIGTLAGGIAHDFNNMIGAILGNAELASLDSVADDKVAVQESLEEIRKAGMRARDLVQQILAFSRRQATEFAAVSLPRILDESMRLLRTTLPARLSIDYQCAAGVPAVLADETQIEQVMLNLVTNAAQAMQWRPGLVRVRVEPVMLDESAAAAQGLRAGRHAQITVSDTGPGMDAATLARIFEPFFTTKPRGEGTGLGLSVVHGIVTAHHGAISVQSTPGAGSTFVVYLPASSAAVAPEGRAGDATLQMGSGQHILYVDDDALLVSLVERMLARRGYRVSGFVNQEQALAALRADPAGFDLVLTDFNMPGMSGLDVARTVRTIRPDLPVVIATGYITDELRAQAPEAGVQALIFKANAVEFCEVIQRQLLMPEG